MHGYISSLLVFVPGKCVELRSQKSSKNAGLIHLRARQTNWTLNMEQLQLDFSDSMQKAWCLHWQTNFKKLNFVEFNRRKYILKNVYFRFCFYLLLNQLFFAKHDLKWQCAVYPSSPLNMTYSAKTGGEVSWFPFFSEVGSFQQKYLDLK